MNLRIPGPTMLPPQVREALSAQMINHRGPEFNAMQARIVADLKNFFQTQNDILIFTCSGTGGMESAVINMISPGDPVLAISVGAFGDRFADIAKIYGAQVIPQNFRWGTGADPEAVRASLRENKQIKAVLVQHNETSTAVTNPLREIARVVHEESDALLIVDGISSLGAIELPVDAWGVDVAIAGAQKSWMIPPGLVMISVSPRAWEANTQARTPRYYFDYKKMRNSMAKGETPFTPAVNLYFGLETALEMMKQEGMQNVFARHTRVAAHARTRLKQLGYRLFADETFASETVTAIYNPPNVDHKKWRKVLREQYDTIIAGGQAALVDTISRVGHLGWVNEADIDACLDAMVAAQKQLADESAHRVGVPAN